jgi:hypothetical protein
MSAIEPVSGRLLAGRPANRREKSNEVGYTAQTGTARNDRLEPIDLRRFRMSAAAFASNFNG